MIQNQQVGTKINSDENANVTAGENLKENILVLNCPLCNYALNKSWLNEREVIYSCGNNTVCTIIYNIQHTIYYDILPSNNI